MTKEYRARPEDGLDLPPLPPPWDLYAYVIVAQSDELEMTDHLEQAYWTIKRRTIDPNGEIRLHVHNRDPK